MPKKTGSGKSAPVSPDKHYEVQEAMHVLTRAEQIRKDPKLMADVRALATDLKRIAGRAPAGKGKKDA